MVSAGVHGLQAAALGATAVQTPRMQLDGTSTPPPPAHECPAGFTFCRCCRISSLVWRLGLGGQASCLTTPASSQLLLSLPNTPAGLLAWAADGRAEARRAIDRPRCGGCSCWPSPVPASGACSSAAGPSSCASSCRTPCTCGGNTSAQPPHIFLAPEAPQAYLAPHSGDNHVAHTLTPLSLTCCCWNFAAMHPSAHPPAVQQSWLATQNAQTLAGLLPSCWGTPPQPPRRPPRPSCCLPAAQHVHPTVARLSRC